MLVALPIHHRERMLEHLVHGLPVLAHCFFASREIDHERLTTLHAHRAREHCAVGEAHAISAHAFGNARNRTVAHILGSLWCYVARRKPRTAARDDDIGLETTARCHDRLCNERALIGRYDMRNARPSFFGDKLFEHVARRIGLECTRI